MWFTLGRNVSIAILLMSVIVVAGCTSFTNNQIAERVGEGVEPHEDINYALTSEQSKSLVWMSINLPNNSKVITWWDFGQYVQRYGNTKNVLNYISKEGCVSLAVITMCKPPFESHEKVRDVSEFLFVSNESGALCIAKKYGATHTIASSDLILKSQWWTYFASLSASNYVTAELSETRQILQQNVTAYTYNIGDVGTYTFIVYETNDTLYPFLQLNNTFINIKRIAYFDQDRYFIANLENATLNGTLWLNKDRKSIVFIPPELEKSIFTQLYFFDSAGLANFELIGDWSNEVKLFKINYPENLLC